MYYRDLREFLELLTERQQLKQISLSIDPYLEITEISDRTLRSNGPALLFTSVKNTEFPVLTNLFGTVERIALSMGKQSISELRELGKLLAFLKEPEPPQGLKDAWQKLPIFKQILHMAPKEVSSALWQHHTWIDDEVDLTRLPIQTCWPDDISPLITWGLVVTRGPHHPRQNLGIYRQQLLGKNKLIMRWLAHRGGALDYQAWCQAYPGERFPLVVVLGADPATLLAAVTPIPDTLAEYAFAGLLRGRKTEVINCSDSQLQVPASAEIVLEGYIEPHAIADEGPFGDHTGYYNEVEKFPVFTVTRLSHRPQAIYHSTYTGRPPDEPAILGVALNEIFVPLLQKQFPEIIDFYLPPEACSYRLAVVSIRKQYAGHAQRIMFGVWSFLRQFMYTKWVIVVDEDINIRHWPDVIWALVTRVDPRRDTLIIENSPIDYLDFASPLPGLGSKIGLDATAKWSSETTRTWGKPITMDEAVKQRIDLIWQQLGIFD